MSIAPMTSPNSPQIAANQNSSSSLSRLSAQQQMSGPNLGGSRDPEVVNRPIIPAPAKTSDSETLFGSINTLDRAPCLRETLMFGLAGGSVLGTLRYWRTSLITFSETQARE